MEVNYFRLVTNPHVCMLSHFSCVWLFVNLRTVSPSLLDSPGRNTGVSFHRPLPNPRIKLGSPCLLRWQADSSPLVPPGKPHYPHGRLIQIRGAAFSAFLGDCTSVFPQSILWNWLSPPSSTGEETDIPLCESRCRCCSEASEFMGSWGSSVPTVFVLPPEKSEVLRCWGWPSEVCRVKSRRTGWKGS